MQLFFLNAWFLCGIPIGLSMIDISLAFLCDHQWTHFLFAFFMASLFAETPAANLLMMITFSSLSSFLIYGNFFIPLMYMLPLLFIARYVHYYLYIADYFAIIAAALSINLQIILAAPYITHYSYPLAYTAFEITGNLLCVWFFSLIIDYVRQNRTIARGL